MKASISQHLVGMLNWTQALLISSCYWVLILLQKWLIPFKNLGNSMRSPHSAHMFPIKNRQEASTRIEGMSCVSLCMFVP